MKKEQGIGSNLGIIWPTYCFNVFRYFKYSKVLRGFSIVISTN